MVKEYFMIKALAVIAAFFLAVVWLLVQHYILGPRAVRKIIDDIKSKQGH